jgi:hypothetical protein
MFVNRLILCLILTLASPSVASDFVSAAHFFPVVSRTDGLAGTHWFTSVQIVNPQAEALTITARLSSGGSFQTETVVVPAGETTNWPDFLGDVFGAEGNGALFLEADAASNQNRPPECRAFAASMRIFTEDEGGGSFGQGVPSLDPVTGFLGDWIAYFPAVALWGQTGSGGFRTNVGFWNIGVDDARLWLRLLDASGEQVWEQYVTAGRHDPFVMSLPRDLQLETATLVVDTLGEWLDCAVYISVVDNITGDASFQTSQLMDPDSAAACDGGNLEGTTPMTKVTRNSARLRAFFVGEIQ